MGNYSDTTKHLSHRKSLYFFQDFFLERQVKKQLYGESSLAYMHQTFEIIIYR